MINAMNEPRASGFYWINIDGLGIEIAFWDSQGHGWLLVGTVRKLSRAGITVLSGPLQPPQR